MKTLLSGLLFLASVTAHATSLPNLRRPPSGYFRYNCQAKVSERVNEKSVQGIIDFYFDRIGMLAQGDYTYKQEFSAGDWALTKDSVEDGKLLSQNTIVYFLFDFGEISNPNDGDRIRVAGLIDVKGKVAGSSMGSARFSKKEDLEQNTRLDLPEEQTTVMLEISCKRGK